MDLAKGSYDLVLAEGFLNMVGFEKGMTRILPLLKERGFLILHDEEKNQAEKEILIQQMGGQILDSFVLDPTIWWQHYYQCLDQAIASIEDEDIRKLFCGDLKEIAAYRKDPAAFRSRYSVIQKII